MLSHASMYVFTGVVFITVSQDMMRDIKKLKSKSDFETVVAREKKSEVRKKK